MKSVEMTIKERLKKQIDELLGKENIAHHGYLEMCDEMDSYINRADGEFIHLGTEEYKNMFEKQQGYLNIINECRDEYKPLKKTALKVIRSYETDEVK